eukprot:s439_g15.t1
MRRTMRTSWQEDSVSVQTVTVNGVGSCQILLQAAFRNPHSCQVFTALNMCSPKEIAPKLGQGPEPG